MAVGVDPPSNPHTSRTLLSNTYVTYITHIRTYIRAYVRIYFKYLHTRNTHVCVYAQSGDRGSTVVKVLCYNSIPAGANGFFIDINSFRSRHGQGVDSPSNSNEY